MKNNIKKLITTILSMGIVCTMAFGCGGKGNENNNGGGGNASGKGQTLEIYCLYKGYQDAWLTSTIELFKNQDWVKEKYPGLNIKYTKDSVDATAFQKMTAGPSINPYDILFGVNLQSYEDDGLAADLTDSVYLAEVPGEKGVRVKDKIPERFLNTVRRANAPKREDGEDSYYVVSYVDGCFGMYCNYDLLKQMNLEEPLTTDQFLETAKQIQQKKYKSSLKDGETTVIMNNAGDKYWQASYDIWWTQYEGVEGYNNYFEGYNEEEAIYDDVSVLNQPGRLESLKVIDSILSKYSYEHCTETDYKKAQTAYLMGQGVFHFNGDYFATEMQLEMGALEKKNIKYDIRFMKMPVISSIINRTPTVNSDAQLAKVIKEIDDNKLWKDSQAKVDGVSEEDFNIIAEARCISSRKMGNSQSAVVPSYCDAKEVACDFLRFMYTDEAIKNFAISSKGVIFPSTYDVLRDDDILNSISDINKSKLSLWKGTSNYPCVTLNAPSGTRLGKAGLDVLYFPGSFEQMFILKGDAKMTPEKIIQSDKDHWNPSTWAQMIAMAK